MQGLNSSPSFRRTRTFSDRILVSQPPPWVVHLRIGNLRRADFHAFLARVWPQIEALLPAHKLVNVYLDRIEAVR